MVHKQSQGHLVNSHYTRIIICASKYFSPTSLSVLDHLRKKKPKATTLSVCLSVRPSVRLSLCLSLIRVLHCIGMSVLIGHASIQ